jgi:hypothetical protein
MESVMNGGNSLCGSIPGQFLHPDLVAVQVYLAQQDIIASFLDYHLQDLPEFEGTPHRGNMDEIHISIPSAENLGRTLWMHPLNFPEGNTFLPVLQTLSKV